MYVYIFAYAHLYIHTPIERCSYIRTFTGNYWGFVTLLSVSKGQVSTHHPYHKDQAASWQKNDHRQSPMKGQEKEELGRRGSINAVAVIVKLWGAWVKTGERMAGVIDIIGDEVGT